VVLWGGWLLTAAAFFSVAGFFHEYYLAMLGAPLAALVGAGGSEVGRLYREHRWPAAGLLVAAAAATLALQLSTARAYVGMAWWLWVGVAALSLGAAATIATTAIRPLRRAAPAALALVIAAMLVTPGIWSALTALNASENQSLPAAYSGRASWPANRGGLQVNQALLDYLEPRTQDTTFLMAVPSSMQGSDYVLLYELRP
jgi:4-amino-4-deoxy-L-arabinose transferase-like glycosyltransferase